MYYAIKRTLTILFLLLVSALTIGCGGTNGASDRLKSGLRAAVKTVDEYVFDFGRFGGVRSLDESPFLKSLDNRSLSYEFNEDGMMIRSLDDGKYDRVIYSYDGRSRLVWVSRENVLDDTTTLVRFEWKGKYKVKETATNGGGNLLSFTEYEYDSAGRSKLTKEYDATGELWRYGKSVWTEDGLECETTVYNANDGSVLQKSRYIYGADGNVLRRMVTDSLSHGEWSFRYDDTGLPVYRREVFRNAEGGSFEQETGLEYNDCGDLSTENIIVVREDGDNESYTLHYDYEYDAEGNWIKRVLSKTDVVGGNSVLSTTMREITYFN